jgi:hypothetical protein
VRDPATGAQGSFFIGCNSPPAPVQTPGIGFIRMRWPAPLPAFAATESVICSPLGAVCNIAGLEIRSLAIVFDEGQDTGGPDFFGLAVLDNIDVNGILVGSAQPAPGADDDDDGQGEDHEHNAFHFHGSASHLDRARFSYSDRAQRLRFIARGVQSITSTGPSCVTLVADGKLNGKAGYSATFEACDLSANHRVGQYSISISGPDGFHYEKTSTVSKGKLKIRA